MNTLLKSLETEVITYAETISGVLGVDVDIFDVDLNKIVMTNNFGRHIRGSGEGQGFLQRHVMKTKKTLLLENPRESHICALCDKAYTCPEILDLSAPIILSGEAIGVIGIVCSTNAQRDFILASKDKFLVFIEQIASLIAAKAFEYRQRQTADEQIDALKQLIDAVDRGLLVLDEQETIWHANLSALRLLELTEDTIGAKLSYECTGDVIYGVDEMIFTLGDVQHRVFSRVMTMSVGLRHMTMLVFDTAENVLGAEREKAEQSVGFINLVGSSAETKGLKTLIGKVARARASVLITGESGTGKEVVANSVHYNSPRSSGPFISINCAAIPESLLESELFGYVKGAFSGADPKGRVGKFEVARGGTIFLDEVGDMPLQLQAKLLRVIQERKITRIGSNNPIDVDVRILAATNKDLKKLIEEEKFREDLYYRLNVVEICLEPLRNRRGDILELASHFIEELAREYGVERPQMSVELANILYLYDWPGNAREMRNAIEHTFVMAQDESILGKSHLPQSILAFAERNARSPAKSVRKEPSVNKASVELPSSVSDGEAGRIQALLKTHGTTTEGKRRVAAELGIGLATLYRKLQRYDLA